MKSTGCAPMQTAVPTRRRDEDTDMHRGKALCRHREKMAIHRLRRETSEEISPANTLILGFQPPGQLTHSGADSKTQSQVSHLLFAEFSCPALTAQQQHYTALYLRATAGRAVQSTQIHPSQAASCHCEGRLCGKSPKCS